MWWWVLAVVFPMWMARYSRNVKHIGTTRAQVGMFLCMHSAIIFLKQACENNSLYTMALLSGMIVWDVVVDVQD